MPGVFDRIGSTHKTGPLLLARPRLNVAESHGTCYRNHMDETAAQGESEPTLCPACGQPVPAPTDASIPVIECPYCNNQFFVGAEEAEDSEESAAPEQPNDELDGLRIRQMVHLRRAGIRSRTHAIVATLCCGVAAGEFIFKAQQQRQASGWNLTAILYLIGVFLAVFATTFFSRKAAAIHREMQVAPPPPPPEEEPHFDELSDGSQHAKHLEDMNSGKLE